MNRTTSKPASSCSSPGFIQQVFSNSGSSPRPNTRRVAWSRLFALAPLVLLVWASGVRASSADPLVRQDSEQIDTTGGNEQPGGPGTDSILTEEPTALASESPVPHSIKFNADGRLAEVTQIAELMPEGVTVDGHEIDISGLVAHTGAPIVEASPEWFIELEAAPRIGADIQLTGASVVEYTEAVWGSNPVLLHPVRVVQQGRPETLTMPDGSQLAGCNFVGHMTAGRQVSTAFTEIAYDPVTCKRIVEFGITADSPSDSASVPATDNDSGSATATSDSSGSASPQRETQPHGLAPSETSSSNQFRLEVPDYKAKTRSQVLEPAYPVLEATSEVNAQVEVWNQQPQYSPSRWSWWSNWLVGTGWRRTSHDAWHGRDSNNIFVGEASDYSNSLFANVACTRIPVIGIFLGGTTYAGHTVQTIGYANLTVNHFVSNYKRGACSALLRTTQTDNFWWINES